MKKLWILIFLAIGIVLMSCETSTPTDNDDEDDLTPPAVPGGISLDENASIEDTIKIVWTENTEDDFSKYRVYRCVGQDSLPLYALKTETEINEYTDIGVDYGVTYFYRVSAMDRNDNESDKSAAFSAEAVNIYPPPVPTGFLVYGYNLPGEQPYIKLRWATNPAPDLDYYNIFRGSSRAVQADTNSEYFLTRLEETSYKDTNIVVGKSYYYRITAVDKGVLSSAPTTAESDLALPRPDLVFPENEMNLSSSQPTFEWDRVEGASRYKVIVRESLYSDEIWSGEAEQPDEGEIVSLSYPGTPALVSNQQYYWLVAVYSSDNTSANTYSNQTWSFYGR